MGIRGRNDGGSTNYRQGEFKYQIRPAAWTGSWIDDLSRYVAGKMTFGDAVLAREADRYGAEALVTWNLKDFQGRTAVPVMRPDRFRPGS